MPFCYVPLFLPRLQRVNRRNRQYMFYAAIDKLLKRLESSIAWVVGTGSWSARATLLALAIGLFSSTPNYPLVFSNYYETSWSPVLKKFAHPLYDPSKTEKPTSHESKLTFRLTVPIIGWALGLGQRGTLALYFLAGVALLYLTTILGDRVSGSREVACCLAITVATTWPGMTSFVVLAGGFYDGVAILLLLCSLYARSSAGVATCVFLAGWTDERGILASPLVLLFHGLTEDADVGVRFNPLRAQALAVPTALAGYAGVRLYLSYRFGLGTAQDPWIQTFVSQLHLLPIGLWTALEGGWILVTAAVVDLFVKVRRSPAAWFLLAICPLGFLGIAVLDVTRSMAYLIPAIFVAVKVLRVYESPNRLRQLCLIAAMVSVVCPSYYVDNYNEVEWMLPLPFALVRWATWLTH